MRRILLIAKREYRQHIRTRGFWIGLLLIPVIMVAGTVAPLLLETDSGGDAILIADLSGRFEPAIAQLLELDHQRVILHKLSNYAEEFDVHPADPLIDWKRHSSWYSAAEIAAFQAAGGVEAALARLRPDLPANAAPFEVPKPLVRLAPFPVEVAPSLPRSTLDTLLPAYLGHDPQVATEDGPRRPIAAIVLPAELSAAQPDWQIWTNGGVSHALIEELAETVRRQIRDTELAKNGLDAEAVVRIEAMELSPHVTSPPRVTAVSTNAIRQLIPVGCAWMLWMTIMMVSNVLLHGLIEERSNKLIESLLATVTSHELMSGKLLGVAGIGCTVALTWTGFAIASISFAPPDVALALRPALEPYASFGSVIGLVFYFVTGYLAIATLFLVIGSMSDSMHDAQAYMTPLIVILLAPLVLLRPAMSDPHGPLPVIMSWIPIYTPFVMLGRLGTGVSGFEVIASGLLLVGFISCELMVAGRIFRAMLLRSGQPPKFSALLKLSFGKGLK